MRRGPMKRGKAVATLPSLIERLEKAEGPDRELDEDIAKATGWWWDHVEALWIDETGNEIQDECPEFTASLDVAVGLVPEGWNWQLYGRDVLAQTNHPLGVGRPYCILSLPGTREAGGRGVTPAIAVCIASLKAHQSEKDGS